MIPNFLNLMFPGGISRGKPRKMEALPLDCITLLLHTGAKLHFLSINSILIKHKFQSILVLIWIFGANFFFEQKLGICPSVYYTNFFFIFYRPTFISVNKWANNCTIITTGWPCFLFSHSHRLWEIMTAAPNNLFNVMFTRL